MSDREIVGPVPEGRDPEAYDRLRRRVLWAMPAGLYVIGSGVGRSAGAGPGGEATGSEVEGEGDPPGVNLMTANWCLQVSSDPKLVAVSVEDAAVTTGLIRDGRAFTVSILRREDRAMVRRFVKPVKEIEWDADGRPRSMGGHEVEIGAMGVPRLRAALAWLDCTLHDDLPLGSHVLFTGEVVDAGVTGTEGAGAEGTGASEGDELGEVLRMEDTRMSYGG